MGATKNPIKDYCTVAEAAEAVGVDPNHIRLLLRQGKLSGLRAGPRAWLVAKASLRKFRRHPSKGRPKSSGD